MYFVTISIDKLDNDKFVDVWRLDVASNLRQICYACRIIFQHLRIVEVDDFAILNEECRIWVETGMRRTLIEERNVGGADPLVVILEFKEALTHRHHDSCKSMDATTFTR